MKRFYVIGFLVLMAFDTLAQLSFKQAGNSALPLEFSVAWLARVFGQPWIYGAFVGYIGAFFTWMSLLQRAPIGPAFAASHMELISVTLLSACFFHEPLTVSKIVGGLLILLGVLCLAKDESAGAADKDGHAHAAANANQV